jgi:hypothetical protein
LKERSDGVLVFKKMYDEIEFEHYFRILENMRDGVLVKRVILKDATASFIQNLIRLLGNKDDDSLKYANLKSLSS